MKFKIYQTNIYIYIYIYIYNVTLYTNYNKYYI